MDRQLEKRLSERAVAIGREGNIAAFGELLELLRSSSANARRLAASAMGKLAWMGVDQASAVEALAPVSRCDPHAQTRQYAIKALKAYGVAAKNCLPDLRDMSANPAEKDYIRRDAAAVEFIEEAIRVATATAKHRCQRCHAMVTADEFARSHQSFQRVFCDRCFDEVFLERRNFETQVELNKTIETRDGTVVQSEGERRIAEWLTARGLAYRYDAKYRIIGEFQIRPDFFLPELDVYIEWRPSSLGTRFSVPAGNRQRYRFCPLPPAAEGEPARALRSIADRPYPVPVDRLPTGTSGADSEDPAGDLRRRCLCGSLRDFSMVVRVNSPSSARPITAPAV